MLFRYSKSSNCLFTRCISKYPIEINFEYCLIDLISLIDISTQIKKIVPLLCPELQSFDASITSIIIPNWTCNDNNYTIFDFSRFTLLESIEIADNSFQSVQTFQIDGLNQLKMIKIGDNSFTQNDWCDNTSDDLKSFHILNCESLKFLQIGRLWCTYHNFYFSICITSRHLFI